jgi:hypothetical protein
VQRLAEVTPHHLSPGQAEAAPPGGDSLDDLQTPAALAQAGITAQPRSGGSAAVTNYDPGAAGPQAVARQDPAAGRAVHHGVGE